MPPGWEWLSGRAPCAIESYRGPSVLEQAGSSPVVPCPTKRCFCRSGSSRRGTDWRGSSRPGTRSGGCDVNTSSHSRTRRSPRTWDCKCREYGGGWALRSTVICFWRSSWRYLPDRMKDVESIYDFLFFWGKKKFPYFVTPESRTLRVERKIKAQPYLTLRLLMSYIYGAPSKARNANVVYIWTYVWQR